MVRYRMISHTDVRRLPMIRARIQHWHGGNKPPVPEAVKGSDGNWWVDIEDLVDFVAKHGPMIVSPPTKPPQPECWFIWYNGGASRFTQS